MTELLTAAQMRAIERAAIESGEVTGLELMERAGRGTVEAILAEWPELASGERRAVVLCGPGNNGGDGFVVARLLRERGWAVEVFLYGDPEKLPPDAKVNCGRWVEMGSVERLPLAFGGRGASGSTDVVVDALFGTGLTRPIDPNLTEVVTRELAILHGRLAGPDDRPREPARLDASFADLVREAALPSTVRFVAVDLPSGLCGDSGRTLGWVLPAGLTVTFHREKLGHRLAAGPKHCGVVSVSEIGIGSSAMLAVASRRAVERWIGGALQSGDRNPLIGARAAEMASARLLKTACPPAKFGGHKYDHGHALVLCGGPGKGGAARMAARGALRVGAGLVTLGCPPAALQENASRVDAVMTRPVKGAEGLAAMLEDARLNALALGPGLGTGEREAALVRVALGGAPSAGESNEREESRGAPGSTRGLDEQGAASADPGGGRKGRGPGSGVGARKEGGRDGARGSDKPRPAVVLDADALTILAREPALFALLHDRCVLTPHPGEFKRLFPDIAERLDAPAETGPAYSKVDATREAAARAGCVVLHKGPDTVIAHPDGRAAINSAHYERSAPWLATAGAGDVLTGFIAGLLARGFAPMQAAEAAAWLHVECALEFGPGLIAEDLPEQLPLVFRRLGL